MRGREKEDDWESHVTDHIGGPPFGNLDSRSHRGDKNGDRGFRTPALKRRRLSVEPILSSQPYDAEEYDDNDTTFYSDREDKPHNKQNQAHEANDDFEDLLSTDPTLSSPPPLVYHHPPSTPRFILPTSSTQPRSTLAASNFNDTFIRPLRFKPSDEDREVAVEPLPEHFSPRRRGQKFLAGGLAAEVRSWLVDLESQTTRNSRNAMKVDGWKIKIEVDEVTGGPGAGMTFIRGRRVSSDIDEISSLYHIHMILGGEEGMSEGLRKGGQAVVGKVVGIKGPAWDVEIDGVRWGVSATWEVLD